VANIILPFDGDFEALRAKLVAWGFEIGTRPNAPLFAKGHGVTIHAYRTGKLLLNGARAEEWSRELGPKMGSDVTSSGTRRAQASPHATIYPHGWVLHFDGLCEPGNPGGVAAYGFQVLRDGAVVHEGSGLASPPGPGATNNVAEFRALLEGLRWLNANGVKKPLVRGDSKLIVNTVNGKWRLKALHLKPMHDEARKLLDEMGATLVWVPREQNEEADRLSRVGKADAVRAHPEWGLR
jgi:ribonuclease HI